jgi:class 3 adenylate cyclase
MVLGDVVNTASRVEAVTEPDQIVMTGSTWEMVKDQVRARKISTSTLNGRAEPTELYELIE